MRRGLIIPGVAILILVLPAGRARAWGPDGHKTVATIADKLIAGTNAATQVQTILAGTSLEDAAVWADCAKGVVQTPGNPPTYSYKGAGSFPECAPFETTQGEAEMVDFVKRNYDTCNPKPGEEVCHKQYHYSDISINHDSYSPSFVGARSDDVASAISAMIAVLQGQPAPAPFSIKNQREALLLLVHYVGDIHQPLHVGAIYLDASGNRVNPDASQFDPATDTKGGNNITLGDGKNLHATWDAIPAEMTPTNLDGKWFASAKTVSKTSGAIAKWSTAWATGSVKQAKKAFKNVTFGPRSQDSKGVNHWSATLPSGYDCAMSTIKKTQLTEGGARLAQLLEALWP
jgi:hypothetical protein